MAARSRSIDRFHCGSTRIRFERIRWQFAKGELLLEVVASDCRRLANACRQCAGAIGTPVAIASKKSLIVNGMLAKAATLGEKILCDRKKGAVAAEEIPDEDGPTGPVLHQTKQVSPIVAASQIGLHDGCLDLAAQRPQAQPFRNSEIENSQREQSHNPFAGRR